MIRIKYGSNKQGLREVQINPKKLCDFPQIKKTQKSEPKKKAAPKKTSDTKEKVEVAPTPPKKVWKEKEIPIPATAQPKQTKKVWRKKEPSATTSPRADASSSSKS